MTEKNSGVMDHTQAVQSMMAEKYMLDELSPEERESFENHFFSCAECARDLDAASAFIDNARSVMQTAEAPGAVTSTQPASSRPAVGVGEHSRTTPWFRLPAFGFGALACLLLAIVLIQNLVTVPRLKSELAQAQIPRALASYSLITGNSRGESLPVITPPADEPFILFVDIPARNPNDSYIAKLYSDNSHLEHTLTLSAERVKDTVSLLIPPVSHQGLYTLVVERGGTTSGVEVLRYKFEVRPQK